MNSNKNNLVFSFQNEDEDQDEYDNEDKDQIDEYVERFLLSESVSDSISEATVSDFVSDFVSDSVSEETNQICLAHEYDASYSAKELLKICEFYGVHKECKKYKKMEIIYAILLYESDETNAPSVEKRKLFWEFMRLLKQDKFMKQFVVW